MKYGEWESYPACAACVGEISVYQRWNSGGVCPHCGNKGRFATVIDTKYRVRRFVKTAPLWKFWGDQGHYEYKD